MLIESGHVVTLRLMEATALRFCFSISFLQCVLYLSRRGVQASIKTVETFFLSEIYSFDHVCPLFCAKSEKNVTAFCFVYILYFFDSINSLRVRVSVEMVRTLSWEVVDRVCPLLCASEEDGKPSGYSNLLSSR